MSILTLSEVKNALGIATDNTEWDNVITLLIAGVQNYLENEIGCSLDYSERTSEIWGNDSVVLSLPAWPVKSVISVVDADGNVYVKDEDFAIHHETGMLYFLYGRWWKSTKYTITYTAGYDFSAGEGSDLKALALELVAQQWKRYKDRSFGESGRTFPDGSITYREEELSEKHKRIIDAHKRLTI